MFLRPLEEWSNQTMHRLLALKGSSPFAYETGMLFIAMGVGNALGYIFQIVVARSLGVEAFGQFGALVGIFYVATLGGSAYRIYVAKTVAETAAQSGENAAASAFVKLWTRFLSVFLAAPIVFGAAMKPLASLFHIEATEAVLIIGFAIFGTLLLALVLGLLQGLQKFRHLAFTGYVLPPALKLVSGLGFILAGWQLLGAMAALIVSEFVALGAALFPWRKHFGRASQGEPFPMKHVFSVIFSGLYLAILLGAPTNLDVLLVTHFFTESQAGIYAATATLGKVIIFLTMAVSMVMLPKAAEKHALKMPTMELAYKGILFTLLLSAPVLILFWLIPGAIVYLFFGEPYREVTSLIGWYGTAMVLFALNALLAQYALAVNRRYFVPIASVVTLAITLAIVLWHASLQQVVEVLLIGNCILLVCSSLALFNLLRWRK